MRRALLALLVGTLSACGGAVELTATPRTALEQRLAQGTLARLPSATPTATFESATPEATWTPPPFGRRVTPTAIVAQNARPAAVVRVEGDDNVAIRVDGREQTVAFVGLLPLARTQVGRDVECFSDEATAMLRRLMPVGSPVDVEDDGVVPGRDTRGRMRLYVWLPDGRLVNMELLRQGFAQVAGGDSRARHFQALRLVEREAAREGLGIWSNLTC